MNIYIANDHGGYQLKKAIMAHLEKENHHVVNEGADSKEIVRYPYYASRVASAVSTGRADCGILICNTGIGMSMIANKYKGVRAALVTCEETARLTREHNNANIICLGGKFLDEETACRLVDLFLTTEFAGDRHNISLGLIEEAEEIHFCEGRYDVFNRELLTTDPVFTQRAKRQKVLLDAGALSDCDGMAALSMLLQMERQGKVEVVGIAVSSANPKAAAAANAVAAYYGRGDIPVGASKNGVSKNQEDACTCDIDLPALILNESGHAVSSNGEAPDAVSIMRKALAASGEREVILLTLGTATNLAALLQSAPDAVSSLGGKELVGQKVAEWVCAGGRFPIDSAINRTPFTQDPEAAQYGMNHFENQITFVGSEIGRNILMGSYLTELPQRHPLRLAYEHCGQRGSHYAICSCAVLYAALGLADTFEVQKGSILLNDDGSFDWDPETQSNMAYLLQKADREETAAYIGRIIAEA